MEVVRLNADNFDQMHALLTTVYSRDDGYVADFKKIMPKMGVRDDENMGHHLGIFEDGKLVACMGVYPIELIVAGEKLLFATTGNIATHPSYEGRGYMGAMLEAAMKELDRLGADAARLGGLRSRYNRYGYELCGQNYTFTFTEKNRIRRLSNFGKDISFVKIEPDDTDAISYAVSLYNKGRVIVPRSSHDAYFTMTTWRSVPYIVMRGDERIGYLSVNSAGNSVNEFFGADMDARVDTICAWQERVGESITFSLQMHEIEAVRLFSAVCESSVISSPSQFKIINWEKVVDAFMKLEAMYSYVAEGSLCIEIKGYGTLCLYSQNGEVGCRPCDDTPDISLDALSAARYIFGPYSPIYTAEALPLANAWFPLPLGWNTLDRI